MKVLIITCVVALAALTVADDYVIIDGVNFIELMNDEPKWKATFPCFVDKAPCGDLQELKEAVFKRLREKCGQCTPAQQDKYDRELKHMQQKYPEDYKELWKKAESA